MTGQLNIGVILVTGGKANGLATAVELLGGAGELGLGGDDAQPELFADADDAPGPLTPVERTGKPGRPKHARNRATEEWRQYICSRYPSPLVGLAETWSRSAEALARELGLVTTVPMLAPGQEALRTVYYSEDHPTHAGLVRGYLVWDRLEAFKVQQSAMIAALPYLHQKQPIAIEPKGNQRGLLVLDFGGMTAGQGGAGELAVPFAPIEENQQVIDVEPEKSHAEKSHDAVNPLEYREE